MTNQEPSQSQPQGLKNRVPKANWNTVNRKLYIELAYEEFSKGNRYGMGFTKKGWDNIINEFNRRTKKKYKKKQFKNIHNRLKDEWKIWDKLMNTSGLGYDPLTQTVTTNDERIWEDFIKAYPMAEGYRTKALEHCEMQKAIFNGTHATGDLMCAPNVGKLADECINSRRGPRENPTVVNVDDEPDFVPSTQVDPQPHVGHESGDAGSPGIDEFGHQPHVKRRFGYSFSSHCPSTECKCVAIDNYMSTLSKYLKFKMNHVPLPFKEEEEKYKIQECMRRLKELPGIERGSDLKFFAVELLQSESRRKTFIELADDPEECVLWLKALMEGRLQYPVI